MFNNLNILITGGTGSFGQAFISKILSNYPKINKIVIYSRDEFKQSVMRENYPKKKFPQLRFFIGDIRDKDRLYRAFEGIDIVIHAAALKQVPVAEYNPFEFIKTNVIGAQNIIDACLDNKIKKVVALSTDKAASPINLYGATKLCSDKLFAAANNFKGSKNTIFSIVRYGNVLGSRGSLIPILLSKKNSDIIEITNKEMTRFSILLEEGVEMVLWSLKNMKGSEIFVPKIPSYKVIDVVRAIKPKCKTKIIGIRPGEKIHEEMITVSDSLNTFDLGKYYAIIPSDNHTLHRKYKKIINSKVVKKDFSYNSGTNSNFLSIKELKSLIDKEKIRIK